MVINHSDRLHKSINRSSAYKFEVSFFQVLADRIGYRVILELLYVIFQ